MKVRRRFLKKVHFKLQTKYSLQILFIIFLVASSLTFFTITQFKHGMKDVSSSVQKITEEALLEQMQKKAEVVIITLAKNLINPFYYLDIETINALFKTVKAQEDVIYIYLYDAEGKIVTDGTDANPILGKVLTDEISKKTIASKELLFQKTEDTLDVSTPIFMLDECLGGVRIGFSLSKIKSRILKEKKTIASITGRSTKDTLTMSVIISSVLVFLGIVFSFGIARLLVQPILKLNKTAQKIGNGDLTVKVDIESGDELEELGGSFNQMTVDLKKSRDEIEKYSRTLEQRVEERTRQLKEAQVQVVQSAKMAAIGQLAAGVAHEINNPLGGILGYAQLSLTKLQKLNFGPEELKTFQEYQEYLKHIERESQRCKQIVENLLTFSRRASEPFQPQDVKSVMENTLSLLRYSLEKQNIKLNTEYASNLALVMGNANQLQQVFTNIIINAQHAMPEGGKLNISIGTQEEEKKNIRISFQDTGCGIPKENLERIFEPFFTTKQKWQSIGLGLSICYQIIQQHNGEILVSSEIDKGSIFTVVLPCVT